MSPSLAALTREDPVALVESCHSALTWILRRHQGKPIPRFWIDHPYGEEEITLLEEERRQLVRYLERVASWATPRPVERAEAVDRCRGVHRCHEPASAEVALIDGAWVWSPPHAGQQGAKVFIDRRTGAMWGESAKPKERSKRRKR